MCRPQDFKKNELLLTAKIKFWGRNEISIKFGFHPFAFMIQILKIALLTSSVISIYRAESIAFTCLFTNNPMLNVLCSAILFMWMLMSIRKYL
jgi:hypothetical protein